jgi:hypothetical protein
MSHHRWFTHGLVAQRATQAPAGVSGLGVPHRAIIVVAHVPGKLGAQPLRTVSVPGVSLFNRDDTNTELKSRALPWRPVARALHPV